MTVFNLSFLNKSATKSKDYGYLVDQVSIKENQLASDGKLSQGDYDLLSEEIRNIYNHPGLTQDQRSNLDVKLSQYKESKSTSRLKDVQDISRLTRESEDDLRNATMYLGSDPQLLMEAVADSYDIKMSKLKDSIDQISNSGGDPSQHLAELEETYDKWEDVNNALSSTKNYKGGAPVSDISVYLTTNSKGEISDIKFGRVNEYSGYAETNGVYGGLKIYGKINRKENGKDVFQLGGTKFSAEKKLIFDESTGSVQTSSVLQSERVGGGQMFSKGMQFDVIDPAALKIQRNISPGGYAIGKNGSIYEKLDNGAYRKYVNTQLGNLNVNENDVMKLPSYMEEGILNNVSETIDGSKAFKPTVPAETVPGVSQGPVQFGPQQQSTSVSASSTPGRARSGSPTSKAPAQSQGIAGRTIDAAKSFLGGFFNR